MDYKDYVSGQIKDNFWSMAKRDLIDMLLSRFISASRASTASKILNVGAGVGDDLKVIGAHGLVYVVDIDARALNLIPDSLCREKRVADIASLPYPGDSFDVVTCFDVFEHVRDDSRAMGEVFRVLRRGGMLLFSVPAFQFLFSGHDRALAHERRYDRPLLTKLLKRFKVAYLSYWNCTLSIPVALRRLMRRKKAPREDLVSFSSAQNHFIFRLMRIENRLMGLGIKLPFGLSLVGVCAKV